MKILYKITPLFIFVVMAVISASAQQKTEIIPFNKRLITTGDGVKSHTTWAKFPSKDEKIRKIILKLTLGTPEEDYMSCAHWDYLDKLIIRRTGGVKGDTLNYEIARMLTPYGGKNPKGWNFTWEVDVTDFALLLRDSIELDYVHTGWEPSEDRGWALTTNFEITYGEPAYTPIAIHKVYDGGYKYGNAQDDIENHLVPFEFKTLPKTNYVRNVIFQTGHGMDSLGNSEFAKKWRKVFWNGEEISHKVLWMEGGDNPYYPQAGTWIYDRGNWIPGTLVDPDVCDMIVKGGNQYVYNIDMEPYVIDNPSAEQNLSSYLIEYEIKGKGCDVELYDIVVPSVKDIHGRKNPTVENPVIVVKNHSAETITSMNITYGTVGVKMYEELWKGEIKPFGVAEIKLANRVDNVYDKPKSEFKAVITKVNGKKDRYVQDNSMISSFVPVNIHKGEFVVNLIANNVSEKDNSMVLRNVTTGENVFYYPLGSIKNKSRITEKVKLSDGDYLFEVTDVSGDGLSFWANRDAGNGNCFITDYNNNLVRYFEPDFGNTIRYWFRVDNSHEKENFQKEPVLWTGYKERNFPMFRYKLNNTNGEVKFVIRNYIGKIYTTAVKQADEESVIDFDMTKSPEGLYFVEIWHDGYKTVETFTIYGESKK